MTDGADTRRVSLGELADRRKRGQTATRADAPAREIEPEFWQSARVVMPPGKASVHLRLDRSDG